SGSPETCPRSQSGSRSPTRSARTSRQLTAGGSARISLPSADGGTVNAAIRAASGIDGPRRGRPPGVRAKIPLTPSTGLPAMHSELLSIIVARHCKRAFLPRPVPRETLAAVLTAAAQAPSTRNAQPWQVAVLSGAARDALSRKLCADFDRGVEPRLDYESRPAAAAAVFEQRAAGAGAGLPHATGHR